MKKRLISVIMAAALILPGCFAGTAAADETAAITFADELGNTVTAVPQLGAVSAVVPEGSVGIMAKYDTTSSKELVELSISTDAAAASMVINEFDDKKEVKAFALESFDSAKPLSKSASIGADEGKQLIVSYANDADGASDVTYGGAAYSHKRTSAYEVPVSLGEISAESYNAVKIRYYAGDTEYNRFNICLMSSDEYGTYNSAVNRYLYYTVVPSQVGWNVAEIPFESMMKNNSTDNADTTDVDESERMPLSEAAYWTVMTHEREKMGWAKDSTHTYNESLYIDSIWFENIDYNLDNTDTIDFNNTLLWNRMGTVAGLIRSTSNPGEGKLYSAYVNTTNSNTTGFIDLAAVGFTTNWSGYSSINIRYYTDDVSKVPPVYLSTVQSWVTSNGLNGTAGAYRLKAGLYDSKKPSEAGWVTVSYDLSSEFVKYGASDMISWENIPYLKIANHQMGQFWNASAAPFDNITGIYIDEIWLEGANETVIDFNQASTWTDMGALPQLSQSDEQVYDGKVYSAKISGKSTNWTGFIDLNAVDFITDWSDYSKLKIRYYTSDANYVPAIYLSTYKGWVTSTGTVSSSSGTLLAENQGAYRLKGSLYSSKKPAEAGWVTVEFDLANDLTLYPGKTTNIAMGNIPYLLIPTHQISQYWNSDADAMTDISGVSAYIDSIWLE